MKELYSHKVMTSFYLWFDHMLLSKAQAYSNQTTQLFYTKDDRLDDSFVTYSSPFKQWVADSSVAGAVIPTGVTGNAGLIGRSDGLKFDFDNGRIWLPSGFGTGQTISGGYAVKDFNTYVVSERDNQLIYDGNYQLNSRFMMIPQSGIDPYGYAVPACFLMNTSTENKPFAFGGQQDTKNKMRAIIVTDNIYALDGCISLFRDLTESVIPLVDVKDDQFNEYGDLKSGVYNYDQLAAANAGRYVYLEKVSATKLVSLANAKLSPALRYGIIDFYLSDPRFPKLDISV